MTRDTVGNGQPAMDDALVARLRAAGEHARQQGAPATLQARLDSAYAAYHAGRLGRQQAARAPWPGPRWLTAGALASCLVAALLWQARQDAGRHEGDLARTSPAPLAAPVTQAPRNSGRATPADAANGQPAATAAAPGPGIARVDTRGAATPHVDTPHADESSAEAASADTAMVPAPTPPARAGVASSTLATRLEAGASTEVPRLRGDALPVLSLDVSALRIATTAPAMPSLPMQMPGGRPAVPAMSSGEPREDAGEREAPATQPRPPSQAQHPGAAAGVA